MDPGCLEDTAAHLGAQPSLLRAVACSLRPVHDGEGAPQCWRCGASSREPWLPHKLRKTRCTGGVCLNAVRTENVRQCGEPGVLNL